MRIFDSEPEMKTNHSEWVQMHRNSWLSGEALMHIIMNQLNSVKNMRSHKYFMATMIGFFIQKIFRLFFERILTDFGSNFDLFSKIILTDFGP